MKPRFPFVLLLLTHAVGFVVLSIDVFRDWQILILGVYSVLAAQFFIQLFRWAKG